MKTILKIQNPIPNDIFTTLTQIITQAYPNTTIDLDGQDGHTILLIEDKDRQDPNTEPINITPQQVDMTLQEIKNGSIGMTMPEWFAQLIGGAAADIMSHPDAKNYMEMVLELNVHDPNNYQPYVVTVARSKNQTPTQILKATQTKLETAETNLQKLAQKLTTLGYNPQDLLN